MNTHRANQLSPAEEAILLIAEWQRDGVRRCADRLRAQQLGHAFINLPETTPDVSACQPG